MPVDFLDSIKSPESFHNWLNEWIRQGEPALTGRDAEVVGEQRGTMPENEYIHTLISKFGWIDKQSVADAFQEAMAVFATLETKSYLGAWVKKRTLEILETTRGGMAKELDDLTVLNWQFVDLECKARWRPIGEAKI